MTNLQKTYTEEDESNFERYLGGMGGFWFASSLPQMEDWAQDQVELGRLKPLSDIVPEKKMAIGWYVPSDVKTSFDLQRFFSNWAINQFGFFDVNYDFQI